MVKKYQKICCSLALVIFGGGFVLWLQAYSYQPITPRADFPRRFVYRQPKTALSGDRYQVLQNGELFFVKPVIPPVAAVVNQVAFQSHLVLWGIIGGHNSQAVVGVDPKSNQQTEILKAGDQYDGETIEAIGSDYILIRNQTGRGRVYMGDETPKE